MMVSVGDTVRYTSHNDITVGYEVEEVSESKVLLVSMSGNEARIDREALCSDRFEVVNNG